MNMRAVIQNVRSIAGVLVAVGVLAPACSPAVPASAPVARAEVAPVAVPAPLSQPATLLRTTDADAYVATPRARLGHYSTADGRFGLVLDRTPRTPRALVDGTAQVIDLGVRDRGDGVFTLESSGGDLVLAIDGRGRVLNISDPQREIPLYHDADAQPLSEPPLPTVDASLISTLDARAKAKCGASIHFEIAGTLRPPEVRGGYHTLQRATRAIELLCRDKLGQDAVKQKVHVVRIVQASASRLSLEGGVLRVETDLGSEALGPFTDEIRGFTEKKL